ncbi:DUF5692 family protein [Deltaproteobacteria bacterium TL4]
MLMIFYIVFLMLFLLLMQEILRRNKYLTWFVFLILPFALLPWWLEHGSHNLFSWVKIYSVTMGVCWFTLCRYTQLKDKRWPFYVGYMILALNILEAVLKDISKEHYIHYINAVAGILLIFTLPGPKHIKVDMESKHRDFTWDTPIQWIIGYTLWNFAFIYLCVSRDTYIHIAVLGAPLIIGIFNNKLWLQARGFTLGLFGIMIYTYRPMFSEIMRPNQYDQILGLVAASLSLGWMSLYFVLFMKNKYQAILQPHIGTPTKDELKN